MLLSGSRRKAKGKGGKWEVGQIDDDLSYFFLKIVFVVKDLERQEVNGLK